jgi:hypothetical protein
MDSKETFEKHAKYVDFYKKIKPEKEYWGLGIENECYLMFDGLDSVTPDFIQTRHQAERYSVDYWKNYETGVLEKTLAKLNTGIPTPTYINSYLFRNMDLLGEHETLYTKTPKANPHFSGETVDQYLRRVSPVTVDLFKNHMIYDGDTFEFTTFNFYKATVRTILQELKYIKDTFLKEMNKRLVSKFTIFKKPLIYPQFNYGFAKFASNPRNIAVCNNGTYHINMTLPTKLNPDGSIANPEEFRAQHANAIRAIQWIEPLLIALYGTPDILHCLNPAYAGGSQRLAMSRYIGVGTYDTQTMEKGKLLDTYDYTSQAGGNYFTELHTNSPYTPPKTIGYDFNYNKFTKHGIEFRVLDYFPEEHLEHIVNLLLLACQHSLYVEIPDPRLESQPVWKHFCKKAVQKGSVATVKPEMYIPLFKVFGVNISALTWWPFKGVGNHNVLRVAQILANTLYKSYRNDTICLKMSPFMRPIVLVDYNAEVKKKYRTMLAGVKPTHH